MVRSDTLELGHDAYARRDWDNAYQNLAAADRADLLAPEDLECLATAAYLTGRDEEHDGALERAHRAYRDGGDHAAAARCAFWTGLLLMFRGEMGRASGWLARAERLIGDRDCVERGYLLLPVAERQLRGHDCQAAAATAFDAASRGERFGDRDLTAAARHVEGRALVEQGQTQRGLALVDEVMVAVTAGELSPIMTGLIYCSVIEMCQRSYALDRALEWTAALTRWCEAQSGLVAFTTTCLVRRAEIMRFQGDWTEAMLEARRACERVAQAPDRNPPAAAYYQAAEVHRLRGEFAKAEAAYRAASRQGADPQPGLALLRLAQGRADAAAAAIRRAMTGAAGPLARTAVLPAYLEIALAIGDLDGARTAATELEEIAAAFEAAVLTALAAVGRGELRLAEGDAETALVSLRRAWRIWHDMDAPHHAARTRVLIGLACRLLGDGDGCALEFEAARAVFDRLGAAPDLARLDALTHQTMPEPAHGLSARERQVLRLVAAGKTNRAIAADLTISEKTVARHVSNIFAKLGLSTRTAATAYAFQNGLV
jgi:ATP/maltotriose-dependent transcriptional regulator MalT